MYTFVKVFSNKLKVPHPNWFLKYHYSDGYMDATSFDDARIKSEVSKLLKAKGDVDILNHQQRVAYMANNATDFRRTSQRLNKTLLIRQSGSYMILDDSITITSMCSSIDWPTDNEDAEIVVCENDLNADPKWVNYLKNAYPGKKVDVLNNFRFRTVDGLRKRFAGAKYITFSTTFTDTDWFTLLLEAVDGLQDKTIIGFCPDNSAWDGVMPLIPNSLKGSLIIVPNV